jgi:hypothetical protein
MIGEFHCTAVDRRLVRTDDQFKRRPTLTMLTPPPPRTIREPTEKRREPRPNVTDRSASTPTLAPTIKSLRLCRFIWTREAATHVARA